MRNWDIVELAERFWSLAGCHESFPRSLETPLSWALPVALIKLPRLEVSSLTEWLDRQGIIPPFTVAYRCLRACLLAKAGYGIIFLDGSDSEDERRFSLAHEISHFMLDYWQPREHAFSVLGSGIQDVLDGRRPPTPKERLGGLFQGVSWQTFTHLMDRSPSNQVEHLRILDAEDRADRLALELLAPQKVVLSRLQARAIQWKETSACERVAQILQQEFGLPETVAHGYGHMLVMSQRPAGSFKEWLNG